MVRSRDQMFMNSLATEMPATNGGKRIGILVVAYNAVTTLATVLRRIPPDVWANVEEVVVLDDASHDDTYELAVGYKALSRLENLTVIKNQKNLGYGGNQKLGYEYFIKKGMDVVVLLHGDGQYAPEILAQMYAPIVAGDADAVFGSRMMADYGGPLRGGMPLYKYVGNRILTSFENRWLGMSLTEFHSGYRAYNLKALRHVDMSRMADGFHFDTEIIIKLNHQGFRIKEVPIPTYYGDEICYVNGLKYATDVVRSVFHYKRTIDSVSKYPEFEEYFTHYPIKEGEDSSHHIFQHLVGTGRRVLDVGCGEGFFAERLRAQGNQVVGVDVLRSPRRREAFDEYHQADLNTGLGAARDALRGQEFDRVLLLDVLEHLRSPEDLLRDCQGLLRPTGELLVSLPNIANITVRLSLLLGRFEYQERGILDRTHVRFFTRGSARRLLETTGYEVVRQSVTVMPVDVALGWPSRSRRSRACLRMLGWATRLLPGLLGYQCVLVARPNAPVPELRHAQSLDVSSTPTECSPQVAAVAASSMPAQ